MEQVTTTGVKITIIHFTYDVDGEWRLACMPGMTEFHMTGYHPNYIRTNDPRGVTCQACQKSAAHKEAQLVLDTALRSKSAK